MFLQVLTTRQSLKGPLQTYLAELPAAERGCVVPNASTCGEPQRKRVRKISRKQKRGCQDYLLNELSEFERKAREYLREKHTLRGENHSLEKQTRMWRSINAFNNENVPRIPSEGFWDSFLGDKNRSQHVITVATSGLDDIQVASEPGLSNIHLPLQRLCKLRQNVKSSTQLHTLASRVLATLIHFHHKQTKSIGLDRQARERALLHRTGVSPEEFKKIGKEAQGWLRVVGVFGIGVLAVAGPSAEIE